MIKLIYLFSIILLLMTLSGCVGYMGPLSPEDIAMNAVTKKTAEELKIKYHLFLIGMGGSGKKDKITLSTISFELEYTMSKEKCRKVIIDCIQQFLKNINTDNRLSQYLFEKPFTYKNIEVTIFMSNPDRSSVFHPKFRVATLKDGLIYYKTVDEETNRYKSVEEEPYEEALQKVQFGNELE